jgi:hypothetical protein
MLGERRGAFEKVKCSALKGDRQIRRNGKRQRQ